MKYWLLVLAFFAGCSQYGQLAIRNHQLSDEEIEVARAQLTYLMFVEFEPEQEESDQDCPCGGSGKSGDGFGPCECVASGSACSCANGGTSQTELEPPQKQTDVFQLLCVHGDPQNSTRPDKFYCSLCERWEKNQRPALESAGWKFGDDPAADARMINFRDFEADFGEDITSLPVFAVTMNGNLISDSILKGYQTGAAVADHVNAFRLGKKQVSLTSGSESTHVAVKNRLPLVNGRFSMVKVNSWE